MDLDDRPQIRRYLSQRLRMKGDSTPLLDDEPLFSSGRLDSLDAVEMIIFVETEYGIDFSEINFDLLRLDTVDAIAALVGGPDNQQRP